MNEVIVTAEKKTSITYSVRDCSHAPSTVVLQTLGVGMAGAWETLLCFRRDATVPLIASFRPISRINLDDATSKLLWYAVAVWVVRCRAPTSMCLPTIRAIMSSVNAVAEMKAKVELILSRGVRGTTSKRPPTPGPAPSFAPSPAPGEIESSYFVPVRKGSVNFLRKGKCELEPTELVKSAAAAAAVQLTQWILMSISCSRFVLLFIILQNERWRQVCESARALVHARASLIRFI